MLEILLNFSPDAGHKQGIFLKILLEKNLKFVPNRGGSTVAFNLGLVLLSVEINLNAEKHSCKEHAFRAYGTGFAEIILALWPKIVTLHM